MRLSVHGGSHVTIIHDALDLAVQVPLLRMSLGTPHPSST